MHIDILLLFLKYGFPLLRVYYTTSAYAYYDYFKCNAYNEIYPKSGRLITTFLIYNGLTSERGN